MRLYVDELPAETLLGLLQMYETAIAELRATSDPGVEGLIARFTRLQAEVIAELADRQPVERR